MKNAMVLMFALAATLAAAQDAPPIDMQRARALHQRDQRGESLTPDERTYLDRARALRAAGRDAGSRPAAAEPRPSTGLKPLCDMTAADRHQGEDGGLYGGGRNTPPEGHAKAAAAEAARIVPLDADGKPAADGAVVLAAFSMSNATQEFSTFKRVADADAAKSPRLVIVDCAQGGQAMAEWAPPDAQPWSVAAQRLAGARVTPQQVQAAWVKLANKMPSGPLQEHGRKLEKDTLALLQNARKRFPNLRLAFLGSRTYGGYAGGALNPEPFAYESAFAGRWLILRQIAGDPELNADPSRGPVKAPLLLWGPYLWADGTAGRKADDLVWERADFGGDGVHPSDSGRAKVAKMLLGFFATDPLAKPWFTTGR
jgi:hypothetical protein